MTREGAIITLTNTAFLLRDGTRYMKPEHEKQFREAYEMAIKALEQPEIIRCEDCKWYGRADKRRFYRGMDCLQKRIDTIVPDRDFCSKAERRTDEND